MPEINQIIQRHSGTEIATIFTPHLIPMDRGILSTIYCQSASNDSPEEASREMFNVLAKFYADEPFVRVSETIPTTKDVARTNFCDIAIRQVGNKTVIVSALDNLIKGASGAAVQNFNLMFGLPETTALL
jgi:N-acetyl-gamma-glutamyl-phosphate reductase